MGSQLDLDDLVSSYETARKELAALRKDAMRWRWLVRHAMQAQAEEAPDLAREDEHDKQRAGFDATLLAAHRD